MDAVTCKQAFFEYIRGKHREKVGVVYVEQIGREVAIGWSVCHKPDPFAWDRGLEMARGRAREWKKEGVLVDDIILGLDGEIHLKSKMGMPSHAKPAIRKAILRAVSHYRHSVDWRIILTPLERVSQTARECLGALNRRKERDEAEMNTREGVPVFRFEGALVMPLQSPNRNQVTITRAPLETR